MHFADWDVWLFPCSCIFQGQLSCSIFHIPDRKLRSVWHWIWEGIRKDLQNKQKENQPSPHCGVERRKGWERESIPEGTETLFLYTQDRPGWRWVQTLHQHSCLWRRLGWETLFSSVSERGCHKPAMFVHVLVSLSFWQVYGSMLSI